MKKSDLLNGGVIGCTLENGTCFYFPWYLTILFSLVGHYWKHIAMLCKHLQGLILQLLHVNSQTGNEKARMTTLIKRPPAGNVRLSSCLCCSCINQD